MSKYEINIGTSILSIPNVRTSQTTLNSLFAINPSTAGISYPFQVINQDVTSGNIAITGVGHAPLASGNANSTLVSHTYIGNNNAGNSSYFGLSGSGKPALIITNNAIASLINCNTLDITPLTLGRKINLYGTPADTTTFVYDGLGIAANATVYNVSVTTNSHIFYAATSSVARTELFRVAGTGVVSIPATGSLSLGTPLDIVSGGTGLNAVGTAGYYLSSNGTTMNWVAPSAGSGSVTSVSLAVAGTLTGLFTNTGSGTITTSGAFTLTQAANPTITLAAANKFSVSRATASSTVPMLLVSGGTTADTIGVDVIATVSAVGGTLTNRIGSATTPGNFGGLSFTNNGDNSSANSFIINLDGGSTVSIGRTAVSMNAINVSGTINAASLTASQAVFTDAAKNLISVANTGTGNNVLANSPTLVSPTLGVASATSLATGSLLPVADLTVTLANSQNFTVGNGTNINLAINLKSGVDTTTIATSSGATFSTSATVGDTVVRNVSKQLHFQNGSGASCFSINTSNVFVLRAQPTFTAALSVANGGTGLNTVGGAGTLPVNSRNISLVEWNILVMGDSFFFFVVEPNNCFSQLSTKRRKRRRWRRWRPQGFILCRRRSYYRHGAYKRHWRFNFWIDIYKHQRR